MCVGNPGLGGGVLLWNIPAGKGLQVRFSNHCGVVALQSQGCHKGTVVQGQMQSVFAQPMGGRVASGDD
jgi:hypothetical protein